MYWGWMKSDKILETSHRDLSVLWSDRCYSWTSSPNSCSEWVHKYTDIIPSSHLMSLSVTKFFARLNNKYKWIDRTHLTSNICLVTFLFTSLTNCPTSMELGLERCHQGHHLIKPKTEDLCSNKFSRESLAGGKIPSGWESVFFLQKFAKSLGSPHYPLFRKKYLEKAQTIVRLVSVGWMRIICCTSNKGIWYFQPGKVLSSLHQLDKLAKYHHHCQNNCYSAWGRLAVWVVLGMLHRVKTSQRSLMLGMPISHFLAPITWSLQ